MSIGYFRTVLEPHGEWIDVGDYGPCWIPRGAGRDWRPYTNGNWAYTDAGWTWVSDEPYGWVVYHYGRWADVEDVGWCWVPDTEWAPAWVSFRHSRDYIGWAPLPPEARFRAGVEINFGGWVDAYFDIGPRYYSFVPVRSFGAPRVRDVIIHNEQIINIYADTVNITNINRRDRFVFVGGPDYDELSGRIDGRIPRLRLDRQMDFGENERGDRLRTRVEADRLIVPAPEVSGNPREAITQVSRRVDRAEINRGWRNVPDDRAREIRSKNERDAEAPSRVERELIPTSGRQPGRGPGDRPDADERRGQREDTLGREGDRREQGQGERDAGDRMRGREGDRPGRGDDETRDSQREREQAERERGQRGQQESQRGKQQEQESQRGKQQQESQRGKQQQQESQRGKQQQEESQRGQQESQRGKQESQRGQQESQRGQQESQRGQQDSQRGQQDSQRGQQESQRGKQESQRGKQETERSSERQSSARQGQSQNRSSRGDDTPRPTREVSGQREQQRSQSRESNRQERSSRPGSSGQRGGESRATGRSQGSGRDPSASRTQSGRTDSSRSAGRSSGGSERSSGRSQRSDNPRPTREVSGQQRGGGNRGNQREQR